MVFTATFSDVPLGRLKCPSTTEPNSPVGIRMINKHLHVFMNCDSPWTHSVVTPLTFSQDLPYREQAPSDHDILKFGLELLANPEVPNYREDTQTSIINVEHTFGTIIKVQHTHTHTTVSLLLIPEHTCDFHHRAVVAPWGLVLHDRLLLVSTSKQPPAEGARETQKKRETESQIAQGKMRHSATSTVLRMIVRALCGKEGWL